MGYELNTKAYSLFIQIEVGLREFLIKIIKQYGINKWFHEFLGSIQRDQLNELIARLNEAKSSDSSPNIEDQYLYKLNRAIKSKDFSFKSNKLFHPFYYLSWPDIENLMRKKNNSDIIDNEIGKHNREAITGILSMLNLLRNDIAHSRFISTEDFEVLEASYNQIKSLIPNFNLYLNLQSSEDNLENLYNKLNESIHLIETAEMLPVDKIKEINDFLNECINSFWLNSINPTFLNQIKFLKKMMEDYLTYRQNFGGLYKIIKLKDVNSNLLAEINTQLKNGKI